MSLVCFSYKSSHLKLLWLVRSYFLLHNSRKRKIFRCMGVIHLMRSNMQIKFRKAFALTQANRGSSFHPTIGLWDCLGGKWCLFLLFLHAATVSSRMHTHCGGILWRWGKWLAHEHLHVSAHIKDTFLSLDKHKCTRRVRDGQLFCLITNFIVRPPA